MRILLLLTLFITFNSNASDNPEEKAVLAAHSKYYAARTDRDFATMVSMESKSGVYETYSDGSFHKPGRTWSLEEMGKWVRKTSHFSSAAYGGVHQTSKSDFED